jgi:hypothetical protein
MEKAQAIQFWYEILNKEFKHWVRNAMLLQPTQPTLADVFQLSKCIEMNMVEEQASYIWVWFYFWDHEFGRGGQNGVLNTTIFH